MGTAIFSLHNQHTLHHVSFRLLKPAMLHRLLFVKYFFSFERVFAARV